MKRLTESSKLTNIDWKLYPAGTHFVASIRGKYTTGIIGKQPRDYDSPNMDIFLIQNTLPDREMSQPLPDGFKYSFTIQRGRDADIENEHVVLYYLGADEKKAKDMISSLPKQIFIKGNVVVFVKERSIVQVGCHQVPFKDVLEIAERIRELKTETITKTKKPVVKKKTVKAVKKTSKKKK